MRTWIESPQVTIPPELEKAVGGHLLLSQVLVQRGISDVKAAKAFLNPDLYQPTPPTELPGMQRAVDRIEQAIRLGELIGVWGDFDVDGQTATALLVSMLQDLGARVTYHIPIRASESHGINLPALKRLLDEGVGMLLTCDTGIAEYGAVDYARERGVDVVITDHHELPSRLPKVCAILNPKLLSADSPLATLPGVGVAYKLAEALYQRAGQPEVVESCLDLVALGIVADVAIQSGDTRYMLQCGLKVLRQNQRLGLRMMMELAELVPQSISEEHIGYVLAPRLNSIGRLADANPVVEFLTTQDISRARIRAHELEALNARRRLLTDQVFQAAQAQIERDPGLLSQSVLVLSHPAWPAGVIGIVAGRLAEQYHRPVALISAPPGELARGSARSVEGCDIYTAIAACHDLLKGFGGHTMAAGFSLDEGLIPVFRRALASAVQEMLGGVVFEPQLIMDGYYSLGDLTMEFVEDLERLAPFGPGNLPLTLVSTGLALQQIKPIGRNEKHLRVLVEDEHGNVHKVIWWQGAGLPTPEPLESGFRFDLAYTVRTSNYQGRREIQIEWVDFQPSSDTTVELKADQPQVQVVDFRGESTPLNRLKDLIDEDDLRVWSEGGDRQMLANQGIKTFYREELKPSQRLAIWTTPPGRYELEAVLERVSPTVIYLFAVHPPATQVDSFLKHLAGLCKFAINHNQGRIDVSVLAGATAQRQGTVRLGISWLVESGFIVVLGEAGQEIFLVKGKQRASGDLTYLVNQIKELLDETNAYREFISRSETSGFLLIKPRTPPTS
jgi:single-stranded-DNA-specific exonuclease